MIDLNDFFTSRPVSSYCLNRRKGLNKVSESPKVDYN